MDSISNLPNDIICHIVSSLSAKEAAFTTVLSKRWLNLFTIIPNLHFNDRVENPEKFVGFLGQLFALPASSRVRKLTLLKRLRVFEPADYDEILCCLWYVVKLGVLELELDIKIELGYSFPGDFFVTWFESYSVALKVFPCKTLVVLRLGTDIVIHVLPENALPALKTLVLDSVRFSDLRGCAFQMLLFACPLLEDLVIHYVDCEFWRWSRTVCSPTLRRLTINWKKYSDFDGSDFDFGSITFGTPKLVCLEYSDFIPDEYLIVNFDSLVEAKLDLTMTVNHTWYGGFAGDDDPISSNPTNLFKGLKNVQILTILSTQTLEAIYFFREAIPIFENLNRLSITSNENDDGYYTCMRSLPFLLSKSPNLETLVLESSLHYDHRRPESVCECMLGYSCLLSCPVKVLEITKYKGTKGEMEQMKHFLGKLSCLELVKIRAEARDDEEKFRYAMDLLMFPRASTNCKIEVS